MRRIYVSLYEAMMDGWVPSPWLLDLLRPQYGMYDRKLYDPGIEEHRWEFTLYMPVRDSRYDLVRSTPIFVARPEPMPPVLADGGLPFFVAERVARYTMDPYLWATVRMVGHLALLRRNARINGKPVYPSTAARYLKLDEEDTKTLEMRLMMRDELASAYARAVQLWATPEDRGYARVLLERMRDEGVNPRYWEMLDGVLRGERLPARRRQSGVRPPTSHRPPAEREAARPSGDQPLLLPEPPTSTKD